MSSTEVTTPTHSRLSLLTLGFLFLRLGTLTFGGMWAAVDRIEKELVYRRNLVSAEQIRAMMITAALIPAPKFLAFVGMVGYQLRGYAGSCIALSCLLFPGAIMVLAAVMFLTEGSEGTLLASIQRIVGLGIVGLMLGNAVRMAMASRVSPAKTAIGLMLGAAVPIGVFFGNLSLLLLAVSALALGALFIRPEKSAMTADPTEPDSETKP